MDLGPKLGDAASLWNFTPSPGAPAKSVERWGLREAANSASRPR